MGQALRRSGASFDCGRRRFVRQGLFGAPRCAAGAASLAMTRLVVTADAEADTSSILDYFEREASLRIAENYGRRFRAARAVCRFTGNRTVATRARTERSHCNRLSLRADLRIRAARQHSYAAACAARPTQHHAGIAQTESPLARCLLAASASFTAALMSASVNGFRITSWISASRLDAR